MKESSRVLATFLFALFMSASPAFADGPIELYRFSDMEKAEKNLACEAILSRSGLEKLGFPMESLSAITDDARLVLADLLSEHGHSYGAYLNHRLEALRLFQKGQTVQAHRVKTVAEGMLVKNAKSWIPSELRKNASGVFVDRNGVLAGLAFDSIDSFRRFLKAGGQRSFEDHGFYALDLEHKIYDPSQRLSPELLTKLAQWKTLTHLNLSRHSLADSQLRILAASQSIKILTLQDSKISDEGAEALVENKSIETLDLSHNNLTADGAIALSKMSSLKKLFLPGNHIGNSGASALGENRSIEVLNLAMNGISDAGVTALLRNTALRELSLDYNQLRNRGVRAIALSSVVRVSLKSVGLGPRQAKILSESTGIKSLNAENNLIGNQGVCALAQNPVLTHLGLSNLWEDPETRRGKTGQFDLETMEAIAKSTSLTHLDLSENDLTDSHLNALRRSRITNFNLNGNRLISAKSLRPFIQNGVVKHIELASTDVGGAAIRAARNAPQLSFLDVRDSFGKEKETSTAAPQTLTVLADRRKRSAPVLYTPFELKIPRIAEEEDYR